MMPPTDARICQRDDGHRGSKFLHGLIACPRLFNGGIWVEEGTRRFPVRYPL
jgi:hypothetical protein